MIGWLRMTLVWVSISWLSGIWQPAAAQTVIGGATPDSSAMLDIQSATQGVLFPRMTTSQRDAIANPAQGLMLYNLTTKCLEINLGTPSSPDWSDIKCAPVGSIGSLDCPNAALTGTLTADSVASGVSVQVPYTGGNGGTHSGQTVTSTGVTGLTATLAAGSFANGADSLSYTITGTPDSAGTASFALNIGGQSCTLEVTVGAGSCTTPTDCWAMVSATDTLYFLCHNLASANTCADPFTPSWEIIGGYWQWGRKGPDSTQWLNTNTANFAHGPTGSGAGDANEGAIAGWNTTSAPIGSWSDSIKTAEDPCPAGFRVPTEAQWQAMIDNNNESSVGTWTVSATNYSSGNFFGSNLMLPLAGYRESTDGSLSDRGQYGVYWSSSSAGSSNSPELTIYRANGAETYYFGTKTYGFSVRCAAEPPAPPAGSIGAIDCTNAALTGTLTADSVASGVSVQVPYTGGNGGTHSGQTVTSTGVTGLTATLAAGSFANGADSLSYTITGTPDSAGTASFALNIGGQSCTLEVTVGAGSPAAAPSCWAMGSATDTLYFMCHNLAANNTSADPLTPSWEIIGGYWQWGRKGPAAPQWLNTNTTNFAHGPTSAGNANSVAVAGWSQTTAANGSWSDTSKTAQDPCPEGFRVPTRAQWDGVIANNNQSAIGTWTANATNYSSGRFYGPGLMLPAAGRRVSNNGSLFFRGFVGFYWSSTEDGSSARNLEFSSSYSSSSLEVRTTGFSVRCAAEPPAPPAGSIGAIDCTNAALTGTLTADSVASGVSVQVPYTGGNGGTHSGQTVTSTGVTGLTATLASGSFATGADSLSYTISGTPDSAGTASFALNIGGQSCTLELTVGAGSCTTPTDCWAMVSSTDTLYFLCHNLASANTCADPFTPSWEIIGGYWQWGRKGPDSTQWLNTNTANFAHGPTGSGAGDANEGAVSGWSNTAASNGAWSDASKTADDPCPAGYRVPTVAQWDGVVANNSLSDIGTWSDNATNYSSGKSIGSKLMLPAAGYRDGNDGILVYRGSYGNYWSSSELGSSLAWYLNFNSGNVLTDLNTQVLGFSVRCAADPAAPASGSIGAIDCTNAALTGTLTADSVASGVSVQVPYTGGNGGTHSGQTVTSTGVTGLTATLASGSFATGADSLSYTISGTPDSAGTASFALNIGGQSCTLELTVVSGGSATAPSCWAMVSSTDTLHFMCHNLASANTSADPLTPSWEIIGGYWQWGRKGPDATQWLNNNTPNFAHGPTGPNAGDANDAAVSGWSTTNASTGAWSDTVKTADDPCPAGYRVPTKAQWDGVLANNNLSDIGTWSSNATNYSSGKSIGSNLMLPAAGYRIYGDGSLASRGNDGNYWSSLEYSSTESWGLFIYSGDAEMDFYIGGYGLSVRCAAE